MAVPETFITDFSLKNTIANIEGRLDKDGTPHDEDGDDDVMPSAAAEMGAGKLVILFMFCAPCFRTKTSIINCAWRPCTDNAH